jgi:hypothetical protein
MFNPARLREVLREFLLRYRAHFTLFVEQDAAVAGCARIERHYILCHLFYLSSFNYDWQ